MLKIFYPNGKISRWWPTYLEQFPEITDYLLTRFPDYENDPDKIKETIIRIHHNLEISEKCPICGKPCRVSDTLYKPYTGIITYFARTCGSLDCSKKLIALKHTKEKPPVHVKTEEEKAFIRQEKQRKTKEACMLKYGVDNPAKSPEIQKKIRETCQARYGTDYVTQTKEFIETALQTKRSKYGCGQNVEKIKETCRANYGVDWPSQIEQTKEHVRQTMNERFGGNAPICDPSIKEKTILTMTERHGGMGFASPSIFEKAAQTNLERYGDSVYIKTDDFAEKSKETCLKNWGVENSFQSQAVRDKIALSNLEKYGYENPWSAPEVRDKIKQTMVDKYGAEYALQSQELKDKQKANSLAKYGVEYPNQSPEIRQKLSEQLSLPEVQAKINESKKKNKSFNTSRGEEQMFEIIKEKFPTVKRSYRSDVYPFNCDFYIPELDYYIEYQGSQYHHKHPFDPTNEDDNKELERLKQKIEDYKVKYGHDKCQYVGMINTWTIRDVKKREIARLNKINFKEIWNVQEGREFINKLFEETNI